MYAAERPFAPASPYDAERTLSEVVIPRRRHCAGSSVAPVRDQPRSGPMLAPGYSTRQQATADRAARLLAVCDAALDGDGASLSVFEADRRASELRRVRACAGDALGAAVSWLR